MSFDDDLEDVLSALVNEARSDFAAAQERVDGLIDQTELRARPKLVRVLRRLGQAAGVPFSLPVYYRPKRQPTPLRREGWSVVSGRVLQASGHMEARLKSRHKRTEEILGLTLASAIFNGCLLRPELWRPFCEAIAQGTPLRRAARFPDLVWLDLNRWGGCRPPPYPQASAVSCLSCDTFSGGRSSVVAVLEASRF